MQALYLKALILLALLPSPAAAATSFEFVSEQNIVVPVLWNYREVASRTVLGCRQWDVLQGGGWFQATWHTDYTPLAQGNVYTVKHQPKLGPKICAAKMDAYNSVIVEVGDLRAFFSVNPDGISSEASVSCRPMSTGSESATLVCDEAHVAVSGQGTVRIFIRYED